MLEVLHGDGPGAGVTLPDGRVIRNLTAAEYAATYTEPGATGGHDLPPDVLAAAEREAR